MNDANLKKNMLWNAAGNLIYLGCQWLVTVLVTNLGQFRDAGLLSIAMSVSATFQTLAMFGIRSYQVSDIENKYSNTCYVLFRLITCAAALVGCMGFSLVTGYRGEQLLCILLFMLFRLAENFSDVLHGIAQKNDRLDVAGKSFAIKGVGLLALFLLGYRLGGNLAVGLFAMAAFSIASTLVYDLPATRRVSDFRLSERGNRWLRLGRECLPLCAYLFLSSAMVTLPKLILERRCGGELLGAYSSIFAPAMLIQAAMGYVYNPFAQMLAALRQKADHRGFLTLSAKITGAILALALLMTVAAYFLGEFLLVLLFGDAIRPYVSLLIPILLAITVTSLFGFLCMLAIVLRRFAWLLCSCGVGFVLCLVLSAPMIDAFSANGTSYALILATVVACLILTCAILWDLLSSNRTKKGD